MKITADFTRLHKGEAGKSLKITLSEQHRDKKVRLGFLTPLGRAYFTDFLELTDGEGSFSTDERLTDGRGILLCQLFLTDDKGEYVLKGDVERFHVYNSVNDEEQEFPDSEIKDRAASLWEGDGKNADYSGLYTASLG